MLMETKQKKKYLEFLKNQRIILSAATQLTEH